MTTEDLVQRKRKEILEIARRHGAVDVRLFGSAARGEACSDSDLDLLVKPGPKTSPGSQLDSFWTWKSFWGAR